jgi:hypothetical protein
MYTLSLKVMALGLLAGAFVEGGLIVCISDIRWPPSPTWKQSNCVNM